MKVSVIIAAYNSEKYLAETLDSIIYQTIDDYEIIIVDDGSTDSTPQILDEYANRCENMTIIHQENGGPSKARNAGLDIAKGEFIFFFDADDILELSALEDFYNTAVKNKADVVIAQYDIFNRYQTININNIRELVQLDKIEKYEPLLLWTFSLSNKFFKHSLIKKNHFRFAPISYSEDGVFAMNCIYHSSKIVGLDEITFHYRRMFDGEADSITASVSPDKIKDYITAHRLILESAERSILRDYPKYKTIEEAKNADTKIATYLNDILRKELQVIVNQFYSKFWSVDKESRKLIVDEINDKLPKMDMRTLSVMKNTLFDTSFANLFVDSNDVLKSAVFTAVLNGSQNNVDNFVEALASLCNQTLVPMKIIVPKYMQEIIEQNDLAKENLFYIDANSKEDLYAKALEQADTPYIAFCSSKFAYGVGAFKLASRIFKNSRNDFFVELVYHKEFEQPQPVYLSSVAMNSVSINKQYNKMLYLDNILSNKFFRVDFLRKEKIDFRQPQNAVIRQCYNRGYFVFRNDANIIWSATEKEYKDYIITDESRDFVETCLKEKSDINTLSLNDSVLQLKPGESLTKLLVPPERDFAEKQLAKKYKKYSDKELKNQVLFFSIRKDGELEGNAKALFPYIKGEKVIASQRLPHDYHTSAKMIREITTSKVIVTDDYVRYLRHFPIKKDQRVIQLWHACGAFKKFGQHGTNISVKVDNATHAQYNLVCVSSESLRPIYADAFDINIEKVKALGCPRTDDFFNANLAEETKQKVYAAYPELKDKYVIIYAPTFRDVGTDRSVFNPELNFDKLSKSLLPDQHFVICPHPVMKNNIIDKEYPNISVMREFSTNDMMFMSDMLITDYSSVIFEYALLKKPMAFFCYDLPVYNRGFYLHYPQDLPGDVYENQEALTDFIRNKDKHFVSEKHETFVSKYMSACDGNCCERIAKIINDYMEGNR